MQGPSPRQSIFWTRMFIGAAVFNFFFGLPIMLVPRWSYRVAYRPALGRDEAMTVRFWRDFGFAVVLIGGGYYLVSRDVNQNRGIVWLGIGAKLFDVFVLTSRFARGIAKPIVLLPALVDGGFVLLFAAFLRRTGSNRRQ